LSIVTTTRKFFTVLCSIFFYSHPVNAIQWVSIFLVFAGVISELFNDPKKGGKDHGKEKSVTKDPESVELTT